MNPVALTLSVTVAVVALLPSISSASGLDHTHPSGSSLYSGREKKTHLHFFVHDRQSSPNPVVVKVAGPNVSMPAGFGDVFVFDDPITYGLELSDDAIVGRAQGLAVGTGQQESSLFLGSDYTFTKGEHAGGSFVVASRNAIADTIREVAIVGGRGKFRMARGFALTRTVVFDIKKGDGILEYNATLFHY